MANEDMADDPRMRAAKAGLTASSQRLASAWAMVSSSAAISAEQQKVEVCSSLINQYLQRERLKLMTSPTQYRGRWTQRLLENLQSLRVRLGSQAVAFVRRCWAVCTVRRPRQ